jgi:hypothetical protein
MKNYSNILKKGLLMLIMGILFLPLLQNKLNLWDIKPLKGAIQNEEEGTFSKNNWFSGTFQEMQEKHLNAMFGFRNDLVRLNNQITYSLFNEAKANDVIIGKENYLYEKSYIDAYVGNDFLGEDSITKMINQLKFINDTLLKLNKNLIIVLAPGKASFYPEYIPDKYLPVLKHTNYKSFSEGIKRKSLNVIDFNKWFIENKNKSKYPLYPKNGIHWSNYAVALVIDSLIKKIETTRNIDLPNLYFNKVIIEKPKGDDNDIADGMNLLVELKGYDLAYPSIITEDGLNKIKPSVLTISDSYYWGIYNMGISKCFTNDHFWYYNKLVYPETFKQELQVEDLDLEHEIKNHDVIIIMATEANLKNFGWGIVENLNHLFKGTYQTIHKQDVLNKQVVQYIDLIKKDKQWLSDTKIRAKEKNITIDSMLVLEALWQINQQKTN